MSWQPDFWLNEKDFKDLESKIKSYLMFEGVDFEIFEFYIGDLPGVVIAGHESTSRNRDLHYLFKDVPHYILNGEGEYCKKCITWGKEVKI